MTRWAKSCVGALLYCCTLEVSKGMGFMVSSFPPDINSPHGGVEAVSVNLVKALARFDDLEIHVVTTDRKCERQRATSWDGR